MAKKQYKDEVTDETQEVELAQDVVPLVFDGQLVTLLYAIKHNLLHHNCPEHTHQILKEIDKAIKSPALSNSHRY